MCNHKQLCSEEMEYCKSKNKKEKITQKQQAMHKNADIILQRKITWVNPSIKSLNWSNTITTVFNTRFTTQNVIITIGRFLAKAQSSVSSAFFLHML